MTDDMMNLRSLVEKSADADLLREMIRSSACQQQADTHPTLWDEPWSSKLHHVLGHDLTWCRSGFTPGAGSLRRGQKCPVTIGPSSEFEERQRHAGRELYSFKQSILRSAPNALKIAGQMESNET
ncbi:hypothetical protein [Rhizobium sp. CCGE532]|uniref:hypothetical protein n=1 Tax=Rhizobium sp. CCGE532 TaxID=2364272 RepID=UPI000EA86ED3|nr:hypothetical protein [Rhizobium sp. CCGE532]AYG76729.1 hypothetical protein CCGE532_29750 [Rhizobium sp. CCGE532]